METIDLKQTDLFSTELTELHQLVLDEAQRGMAIQSTLKESDVFALHEKEAYASAIKRVIVILCGEANNMLSEVLKISSSKGQEMTYEVC